MKQIHMTSGVIVALLLASSAVGAEEYPAADYQPKVLYRDADYKSSETSSSASAAKIEEVADPNFPAANYQPKVLYSDSSYTHSSAAPSASGAVSAAVSTATTGSSASTGVAAVENKSSSNTSLLGLIILAVAGVVFFNKKSKGKPSSATSAYASTGSSTSEGPTGVERYLEKIAPSKTGVAKYIEKQSSVPVTGVAKYMAKQVIRDKEAAAANATGVEKYLRKRG